MVERSLVVVTGIPGVGKTTVLRGLERVAEGAGLKLKIVTFSTVMLNIAKSEGKTFERDGLRKLPISKQRDLQRRAAVEIAGMVQGNETLIVDTHMVVRTGVGYWSGLPQNVLDELKPNLLVLLEADPREVLQRRAGDNSRSRDRVAIDEIVDEMSVARSIAASCATFTGAPFKVIKNPTGRKMEVAEELLKAIIEIRRG